MSIARAIHLLKNIPAQEIVKALERDGFYLKRSTRSGGHIYSRLDGRIVVIHYHHGNDTFKRKTLKSILDGAGWTKEDLKKLKLLK